MGRALDRRSHRGTQQPFRSPDETLARRPRLLPSLQPDRPALPSIACLPGRDGAVTGAAHDHRSVAWRSTTRAVILAAAVIAVGAMGNGFLTPSALTPWTNTGGRSDLAWIALALLYVLLMALPFVPGIEVGLALMLLLGDRGIVLVYVCTQIALALSFIAGRCISMPALISALRSSKLRRTQHLVDCLAAACARAGRVASEGQTAPAWTQHTLKHRYLALAAALNLPGNTIVGGAGGLGLMAGASGLFSFPRYCLLVAAATSPLPLLLALRGTWPW